MPLPVAGGLQRVDREHLVACGDQRLRPRATVGLDADLHHRVLDPLTQLRGDHRVQPGHARHTLGQPGPGQPPARGVHQTT